MVEVLGTMLEPPICMLLYQIACSRNGDSCALFRNIDKLILSHLNKYEYIGSEIEDDWHMELWRGSLEPPYTGPYVGWFGRSEGAAPPPTRLRPIQTDQN